MIIIKIENRPSNIDLFLINLVGNENTKAAQLQTQIPLKGVSNRLQLDCYWINRCEVINDIEIITISENIFIFFENLIIPYRNKGQIK